MLKKLLAISLALLPACAPTTQGQPSNTIQSFEGVWLKKSVADSVRTQSTRECGTLTTTTPNAFAVRADGHLSLISNSEIPLALGQTDASGTLNAGIFDKLQIDGNTLRAQSALGGSPTEFVRSTETEVIQALNATDECLASTEQPQTSQDWENKAILAKNKIILSRAQSSSLNPALIATTTLLTGSGSAYAYAHFKYQKTLGVAANARQREVAFFTSQLEKKTHELYKPVGQEFAQFKEELSKRFIPNSRWAPGVDPTWFHDPGVDLLTFDAAFELYGPLENGIHIEKSRGPVELRGSKENPKAFKRIGQGHVKLKEPDVVRLEAMKSKRAKLIEDARAEAKTFKPSEAVTAIEQKAMRVGHIRTLAGGITLAALVFEAWTLWNSLQSSSDADEVSAMTALPDPELREHLRRHPNSGNLLIEAANKM